MVIGRVILVNSFSDRTGIPALLPPPAPASFHTSLPVFVAWRKSQLLI